MNCRRMNTHDLEDDIPGLEEEDSDAVQDNLSCDREIFEFKDGTVMRKRKNPRKSSDITTSV